MGLYLGFERQHWDRCWKYVFWSSLAQRAFSSLFFFFFGMKWCTIQRTKAVNHVVQIEISSEGYCDCSRFHWRPESWGWIQRPPNLTFCIKNHFIWCCDISLLLEVVINTCAIYNSNHHRGKKHIELQLFSPNDKRGKFEILQNSLQYVGSCWENNCCWLVSNHPNWPTAFS